MDIKKRRRRRIATLIVIAIVIVAGLAGVMALQRSKRAQEANQHRTEGLAAYESKDYVKAIEHLGKYLAPNPNDAEAQHAFAKANLEVPQARNGHIRQAIASLRLAVDLDPTNLTAARELLEIYRLINANDEALKLAERMLQADPDDALAMGDQAIALSRLNRAAEAETAARAAVALEPDNYRLHLILLQVLNQLKTPKEELVAYGAAQAEAHPGDPRFELVAGLASALAGGSADTDKAKGWLRQAASRPLDDARFAADLVSVLDTLGMWSESIAVLKQGADLGDVNLATDYARRLLETEQYAAIAERFAGVGTEGDRAGKLDQQVLYVMALHNLGRQDELGRAIAGIAARTDAPLAATWANVLAQVYDTQVEPPRRVEAIKEALATIIDNAYLHAFLGDAYSSLGDHELSLQHWQRAAELRPSWGGVRLLVARAMLNANRPKDAVGYAEAALVRMPDSLAAAVTVIRARTEAMGTVEGDSPQRVIDLIDKVQRVAAGEPQTLIAKIDLLPRVGKKDEAKRVAEELLAREDGLPQQLLGRLAEVSRRHGLALEGQLQQQYATQMEGTPELALTEATGLARKGQLQQGLALMDKGLVEAPAAQKLSWELARATYLDAVGDASSAATWAKLADNNAEDRRVQQMALRASSVQNDRVLTERVLNRLQTLMGADSIPWQTERARWLAGSGKEGDATQAVTLLRQVIERAPKRVEPRLLLAQTLVKLNRPQLAIQELRAAEQAVPKSVDLWLELARLYQSQRDFANALNYLDQALSSPDIDDTDRREAASLLARQGEFNRAIGLVERLTADDGGTPEERLLLASLYVRANRPADADRLFPALLDEPTAPVLTLALDFYTSQGDSERVRAVMSQLESAPIPDAARQRVLGEHAARTGDLAAAARHFAAASDAAPTDAELWRHRVRLELMQGHAQPAITLAQAGLKQAPADAGLQAFVNRASLVAGGVDDPWGRRLLMAMIEDPAQSDAAAGALTALRDAKVDDAASRAATATKLAELARANPALLPLQLLTTRKLLETGQVPAAVDVSTRAAIAFPEANEALAMQAEALAAAGRWEDALAVGSQWRRKSDASPMAPDLVMAEAHLQLRQPDRALQRLEAYTADAQADPDAFRDVIARRLRALLALKRHREATEIITPLLSRSPAWRSVVLTLASNDVQDEAVAADWVRQAEAASEAGNLREKLAAMQAWWAMGERFRSAATFAEARRVTLDVTANPEAPAMAWYMRGVLAEQAGDRPAAEQAYRETLKRDANQNAAKNNLAMLLSQGSASSPEALDLAQAVVRAEPSNAAYLDTLAHVQAQAGQVDAAAETMRKVITLDPTTKTWYENLAKILEDAGRADEARKVMEQYEARALRR